MEMSKGVSLLRTAQSLLTGRTIYGQFFIKTVRGLLILYGFFVFKEQAITGDIYMVSSETVLV